MDRSQSLLIALIAVFWSLVFNASNALAHHILSRKKLGKWSRRLALYTRNKFL
jgi:hypothetical protein